MSRHLQSIKFKDLDVNIKRRMIKDNQVVIIYTDKLQKNTQIEIQNEIKTSFDMIVFKNCGTVDKIDKLKDKINENIKSIQKGLVFENYPRNVKQIKELEDMLLKNYNLTLTKVISFVPDAKQNKTTHKDDNEEQFVQYLTGKNLLHTIENDENKLVYLSTILLDVDLKNEEQDKELYDIELKIQEQKDSLTFLRQLFFIFFLILITLVAIQSSRESNPLRSTILKTFNSRFIEQPNTNPFIRKEQEIDVESYDKIQDLKKLPNLHEVLKAVIIEPGLKNLNLQIDKHLKLFNQTQNKHAKIDQSHDFDFEQILNQFQQEKGQANMENNGQDKNDDKEFQLFIEQFIEVFKLDTHKCNQILSQIINVNNLKFDPTILSEIYNYNPGLFSAINPKSSQERKHELKGHWMRKHMVTAIQGHPIKVLDDNNQYTTVQCFKRFKSFLQDQNSKLKYQKK